MAVNIGRNNMKRLILLVIAVFLVIGGSAIAAIPDTTDGEIHACIKNIGGTIRIIDHQAGEGCIIDESDITWGQTIVKSHKGVEITISPGGTDYAYAYCFSGWTATGGGYRITPVGGGEDDFVALRSMPTSHLGLNEGWTAGVASTNTSNKTLKLDVFVRCVKEQ